MSHQGVNFLSQKNPEKTKALRKTAKRNPFHSEAIFQHKHTNILCFALPLGLNFLFSIRNQRDSD